MIAGARKSDAMAFATLGEFCDAGEKGELARIKAKCRPAGDAGFAIGL